jgi:hypothetical protein
MASNDDAALSFHDTVVPDTAGGEGAAQEPLANEERERTSGIFLAAAADASAPSRDQSRSRRKRAVRARTLSLRRTSKVEQALARAHSEAPPAPEDDDRPLTRSHCAEGIRPCPYVSCKHHLYLDVSPRTGAIKLNFPDLEVWELEESCALDVAEREGTTLEEAGVIMNLTRERVRQLEVSSLAKLARLPEVCELPEGEGPVGKRKLPVLQGGRLKRVSHVAPTGPAAIVPQIPRHDAVPLDLSEGFGDAQELEPEFDVEAFASDDLSEICA